MTVLHQEFSIAGEEGQPIRCDIRRLESAGPEPKIAIFCHGFKGFKDWGGWPLFREKLAAAGIAAVGVNFSHNGIGAEPTVFSRLDLFQKDTFSVQARDLNRVLDRAGAWPPAEGLGNPYRPQPGRGSGAGPGGGRIGDWNSAACCNRPVAGDFS
jgi:hypothetical protein